MVLENLAGWWKELTSQRSGQQAKRERPIKQAQLHVYTELNALSEVLQWFEQFKIAPLPCDQWWQCETVLAEGFTNAVRHAHKHLPQTTPIDLEVTIFSHYLEMRIWDRGQPFDLEAYLEEIDKNPLDPFREERRGVIFMKTLTDELCYTRTSDGGNCLIMRKKISPYPASTG